MRRALVLIGTVMIALLAFAPVASASSVVVTRGEQTFTSDPITDICSTTFTVSTYQQFVEVDRFDRSGNLVAIDASIRKDVDTFLVDGVPKLVSEPFAFHAVIWLSPTGEFSRLDMTGIVERVRLPDGTLFLSAGFVTPQLEMPFYIVPDVGASGDLVAFCAALAA